MTEIFVAKASELPDGERRIVSHDGVEIGVFHWQGAFYAYRNLCLHQGGPACEGLIRCSRWPLGTATVIADASSRYVDVTRAWASPWAC